MRTANLKTDATLTRAETRVAMAYVLGDIGKEVGERLGIAYYTVVRHTQNIYEKALARRAGASFLMVIMCATIFFGPDDMMARRARRGRRRGEEVEYLTES